MGKHHIKLSCEEREETFIHKFMFKSIRNKVLQKLTLIYYNIFYKEDSEPIKTIQKRLIEKHLPLTRANIAWELKPQDITPIIGCSERTAKEYIEAFKTFYR